jgi:hypothetical protein
MDRPLGPRRYRRLTNTTPGQKLPTGFGASLNWPILSYLSRGFCKRMSFNTCRNNEMRSRWFHRGAIKGLPCEPSSRAYISMQHEKAAEKTARARNGRQMPAFVDLGGGTEAAAMLDHRPSDRVPVSPDFFSLALE